MTTPRFNDRAHSTHDPPSGGHDQPSGGHGGPGGHGGNRWLMIACCIPMLLVVGSLLISGVAGTGAIVFAGVCVLMMWLMMKAMH